MAEDETLDVDLAVERLNEALRLQYRSALAFTVAAGSVLGFEYQAIGQQFWGFAQEELADAHRLVEKITSLGGEPTVDVAPLEWSGDGDRAVQWLIDTEADVIEALQAAIEPTGREGRSEALEHLLEHLILRKQNQVDFLIRARGRS
jgi:bacterioferritin